MFTPKKIRHINSYTHQLNLEPLRIQSVISMSHSIFWVVKQDLVLGLVIQGLQ